MDHADYLIIGGGIAGTAAAETIRKRDATGRILILSDEAERLYSRVLLPRYLAGSLERSQLFLRQAADYEQQRIERLFNERVVALDSVEQTVRCTSGRTVRYGKLIVATGGTPNQLGVTGGTLPGVFTFKTIEDTDALIHRASAADAVVVVGGGFIAMELIDAFVQRGLAVTAVLRERFFWEGVLGERGGALVTELTEQRGVRVLTEHSVRRLFGDRTVTGVELITGDVLAADLVGVGVGQNCIQPWFLDAGFRLTSGGIQTNEFLATNLPNVYAAGDVAAFDDQLAGHHHRLGNWLNAQLHGMVAGTSATGGSLPLKSVTLYRADHQGQTVLFLGDLRQSGRTIVELQPTETQFARCFFRADVLVGAALVNITNLIQPLQAAILEQRHYADPRSLKSAASLKHWLEND